MDYFVYLCFIWFYFVLQLRSGAMGRSRDRNDYVSASFNAVQLGASYVAFAELTLVVLDLLFFIHCARFDHDIKFNCGGSG